MTYTSGYQSPSAANTSAYSPFNRAAQQPPQQPGQYAGYPAAVAGNNPFPNTSPLGADTFSPANPGDIDAVSGSIDSKIADIRRAFSQPTNPTPTPGAAVSPVPKADVDWAMALESKIKTQNYQPNAQETARYEQIFQALQAAQAAQTGAAPVAPPSAAPQAPAVSDQEVSWALDMEKKVKAGHTPTAQETAKYNEIFARLNGTNAPGTAPGTGSAPAPVSQADMDWAMALESKVKTQNYQPTAEETARYEKIFKALQAAQQAGQPAGQPATAPGAPAPRPAAPTNWNQWAQPFNVPAAPTMPLPIAGPNGQAVINVPSSLVGAPQSPPAAVMNQVPGSLQTASAAPPSQAEVDWALQLEALVQQGHQPTAQETAQYQDIAKRLQASQQPGAQQQSAAPPQAAAQTAPQSSSPALPPGISEQEVQWAMQLEDKVKQGYQPNAQETAQYQQIAQKVQAAQAGNTPAQPQMQTAPAAAPPAAANPNIPQSLPNGLTQQDIQWAMALEEKVNTQQYQPTPPEMQRHANIAQRLQAAPAQQPAAVPQQPTFQGGVQQVVPQAPRPVQIMPQSYPQVQGQAPQMVVPYQPANNQIPLPAGPQQGMPPGGPPPAAAPQQSAGFMDRLGNAWNALWG